VNPNQLPEVTGRQIFPGAALCRSGMAEKENMKKAIFFRRNFSTGTHYLCKRAQTGHFQVNSRQGAHVYEQGILSHSRGRRQQLPARRVQNQY